MKNTASIVIGLVLAVLPTLLVFQWIGQAQGRLMAAEAEESNAPQVAVASQANEQYCTPRLKKILRRVLTSCGLIQGAAGRGCEPVDAKSVATMSGEDFNALFLPMKNRGSIIQFEQSSADLDPSDLAIVDRSFADRKGASYFFVVSRASPEGSEETNRELSRGRAEAVLDHLHKKFQDPELDDQVGLLWLGEEFAQLDPSFCDWKRSGSDEECTPEDLNRSAFITWIDCTL
jgi:outer membrane protein OmpA-like peptidoglycan-associated protein